MHEALTNTSTHLCTQRGNPLISMAASCKKIGHSCSIYSFCICFVPQPTTADSLVTFNVQYLYYSYLLYLAPLNTVCVFFHPLSLLHVVRSTLAEYLGTDVIKALKELPGRLEAVHYIKGVGGEVMRPAVLRYILKLCLCQVTLSLEQEEDSTFLGEQDRMGQCYGAYL